MDLKNRLIEPDENSTTRFEPFYQITPKELDEICKQYHAEKLRIGGVVVPKGMLSNLDEAIKKAKPNMDKIKDVDEHLDSIR